MSEMYAALLMFEGVKLMRNYGTSTGFGHRRSASSVRSAAVISSHFGHRENFTLFITTSFTQSSITGREKLILILPAGMQTFYFYFVAHFCCKMFCFEESHFTFEGGCGF